METYSHAFYTWALAKHGIKAGRAAGVAGAAGAALPDLPAFLGTAYYAIRDGGMWNEESLDAIYFSGPFGTAGVALHSAVPVAAFLVLYRTFGLGRHDARGILLWFLLGWFGHTIADFLTHVDDTRPLFWPVSSWEWSSPVSYYNPLYYGREFMAINHAVMLLIALWLLVKRVSGRKGTPKGSARTG